MAKCEYCGCVINQDMKVCESCGAPIPENAFAAESSDSQSTAYSDGTGYRLILVSLGSCARSKAEDLLEDLLSYDEDDSRELLDSLPAEASRNLTREQASYLAQALTEYGMEISVCDRDGYVDLGSMESGSVFDDSGNYIRRFAEILAMLTAANRVTRPVRWGQPIDRRHIFMPDCSLPHSPVHRRRNPSLLERLFGVSESSHRKSEPVPPMRGKPEPAPRRETDYNRRPSMTGGGAVRDGSPFMGQNAGAGGRTMGGRGQSSNGSPFMGRNAGAGGRTTGSRSQGRDGLPSMGRGGGPGGGRPGGGRGPSRGHGPR